MGSPLTVNAQLGYARFLIGDGPTSGTAPAFPGAKDTEYYAALAEAYNFLANFFGPRITYLCVGGNTLAGSEASAELGFSVNTGSYRMTTGSRADIEEILSFHDQGAVPGTGGDVVGAIDGPIMDRVEFADIARMRARSTAVGTPRFWAASRLGSTSIPATGTGWVLMIHPSPSLATNYFSARVRLEPAAYTINTTYPDLVAGSAANLMPHETYIAARLAAYDIASYIGKPPAKLDSIAKLIPEEMRASKGIKLHAGVGVASVDND